MFAAMHGIGGTNDAALARLLGGSFARELRRSVEAYLARTGMSPSRLGLLAVNDTKFVGHRLKGGGRVGLNAADGIRGFIGEITFRPVLVCEIEVFLDMTELKGWLVGEYALNQRSFVSRLLAGASPLLRTIDRFRRWMRRHLGFSRWQAMRTVVMRRLVSASIGPQKHGRK